MHLHVARLVAFVFACCMISFGASAQDKLGENRITFVLVSDVYKMNAVNGRGGYARIAGAINQERARGGKVVLISDAEGLAEAGEGCIATIEMPKVHPLIAPLVYAVPVQLLAYHVAVAKGTDVDQPRNLAKSVTVE